MTDNAELGVLRPERKKTMETVTAKYRAKCDTGSSLEMEAELPLELNQMIVWMMHHQADAMYLLTAYRELRQETTVRDEGSAKNHGLEV
jgi:hypothetical protein